MKTFHFPWAVQLYNGEANTDLSPESLLRKEGSVLDSQNMRPSNLDGHFGDREKIHGESLKWSNVDNRPETSGCTGGTGLAFPLTYCCIANYQVLNHIVEFWADETNVGLPYVRVDGWIVLYPKTIDKFPISYSNPPQVHGNNSCVGGEVFYTDNHIPPFILNVTDLLENAGINPANNLKDGTYTPTAKYFCNFNITQYQIQPPAQADHPQFIEIVPTGSTPNQANNSTVVTQNGAGGGGMQVGQYQYAFQYVDSSGNTTNWSELTPQIPMPYGLSYSENVYPSTKVYGSFASGVIHGALGIHIRFRITNTNNYASINIRRVSWDVGASLPTLPNDDSVVATVNLVNGQIGVVDFYDFDNSTIEPITQAASTQSNLSAIQAAKGIRYYDSRLTLWNITYASRDLTSQVTFNTSNGTMYPFVRPLGVQGYKDIWNDVYRKSYFRGEQYGFALVAFDSTGNPTFALPIPGSNSSFPTPNAFSNFRMPNRRDQLTGASLNASVEVSNSLINNTPLTQCYNSSNTVTPTFEVYDMVQGNGTLGASMRDPSGSSLPIHTTPTGVIWDGTQISLGGKILGENDNVYAPFRPTWDGDSGNTFDYRYTVSVNDGFGVDPSIGNGSSVKLPTWPPSSNQTYSSFRRFEPKAFLPNKYALGMVLQGISNLPSWVASFAIVRTAPAGRILAQGQGFYDLTLFNNKDLSGMMWDSPDLFFGVSPINLSNLTTYKAQIVSPQGFFSEVFQGYSAFSSVVTDGTVTASAPLTPDCGVDMISYCRIPYDNQAGFINPISSGNTMNGVLSSGIYYTSWNSWRNTTLNNVTANQEYSISSLTQTSPSDGTGRPTTTWGGAARRNAYYLKLSGAPFYHNSSAPAAGDYKDSGVRDFHEPCYVTNIVNDNLTVASSLVQDYYNTGCFVKISSIIGQIPSNTPTTPPSFVLVDERWQDCIPAERSTDATANQDRYVWIQDTNNNQFAWINVTYKTPAQITTIANAIVANGFYVSTKCDGTTVNCYGMYSHSIKVYTNGNLTSSGNKFYSINFDQKFPSGTSMTPDANSLIIVKYDTCAPIEIFGGDAFIGEYNYPVADCQVSQNNGQPLTNYDKFAISVPLPYRAYQYNENTVTLHNNNEVHFGIPTHVPGLQGFNLIRHTNSGSHPQAAMMMRQLIINGIVESRVNTDLMFGEALSGSPAMVSTASFFPNINYVQRPLIWANGNKYIASQYFNDYPSEDWSYGGFKILPLYNVDYSEVPTQDKSYSKPTTGFTERLSFCSRTLWSDARSTNEQNSPNIKNFPSTNIFDFDDVTGEIKRAWDSSVGKEAGNLYAFTERGIVMALTEKNILTEVSGNQLAVTGNSEDTFIQGQVWLSKDIGMNDQMWRSSAEYNNAVWWGNNLSVYRLRNNELEDIGSPKYGYAKTIRAVLDNIASGYGSDVTGVYNTSNDEYWLALSKHRTIIGIGSPEFVTLYQAGHAVIPPASYSVSQDDILTTYGSTMLGVYVFTIDHTVTNEFYMINNSGTGMAVYFTNPTVSTSLPDGSVWRIYWNGTQWTFDTKVDNLCNDLIWNEGIGWTGQFKYRFDKYTVDTKGNIYGSRLGATYLVDDGGYIMNGVNIQAWVSSVCSPKEEYSTNKEFVRVRSSSNFVPDTISFFTSLTNYNSNTVHSQIASSTPFALKNYGGVNSPGWEGYIPRGSVSPFYRNQGHYTIYTISYAGATDWWISSSEIQFKELKA